MSVCADGSMSNYVSQKSFISIWDIFLSFQYEKYLKRFNMKHKGIGGISIWRETFMIEAEAPWVFSLIQKSSWSLAALYKHTHLKDRI